MKKKYPALHSIEYILHQERLGVRDQTERNGKWYAARPLELSSFWYKFYLAWNVFLGNFNALEWGGDQ